MNGLLRRFSADVRIALLLALGVTGLAVVFSYPHLHPSVWPYYAVGTGLRPSTAIHPALWTWFVRELTEQIGVEWACWLLPHIGRLLLGCLAAGIYFCMYIQLLVFSPRSSRPLRQKAIVRVATILATLAFVTSDPVWTAAQSFSPGFLLFAVVFLAVWMFQRFALFGERAAAWLCSVSLAIVFVETPLALVLMLPMWALVKWWWIKNSDAGFFRKLVCMSRASSFIFGVATFLAVVVAGIRLHYFDWTDAGETADQYHLVNAILYSWLHSVGMAARKEGWFVIIGLAFLPLIGLLAVFRRACDEENQFPFFGTVAFAAYFTFVFFQFALFGRLGAFGLFHRHMFPGELARLPALLMFSFGMAISLVVLATTVFSRRILWKRDKVSHVLLSVVQSASTRFRIRWRRLAVGFLVVFVLSLFVMVSLTGRRQALRNLHAYMVAVVDDAIGCTDLCTDGQLDDGLRLEIARRGITTLNVRPMMSRDHELSGVLQRFGLADSELRLAAEIGPSVYLRTIIRDRPERVGDLAIQVGFDLWRIDLRPLPPAWGTLGRFSGSSQARLHSQKVADALSMLFSFPMSWYVRADVPLAEALDMVRWRLSRMLKFRIDEADMTNEELLSASLRKRQEHLDSVNLTLAELKAGIESKRLSQQRPLAPREVLHLALMRGNSAACGQLARVVLDTDPDNQEAHFAMAISLSAQDDFKEALSHFRFCLKKRPKDAVLLNNIAMTLLNMGRFAEARENAERAKEIAPHVPEIRHTLKQISESESIAATNGVPPRLRLGISDGSGMR